MTIDCFPNENFTIDDVLNTNVPLKDKAWFILHNCDFTNDELKCFAFNCASIVLPIYEKSNKNINTPRKCLEITQAYLNNSVSITELTEAQKNVDDIINAYYSTYNVYNAVNASANKSAIYTIGYAIYSICKTDEYKYVDTHLTTITAYAAANAALAISYHTNEYYNSLLQFFKDFTNSK